MSKPKKLRCPTCGSVLLAGIQHKTPMECIAILRSRVEFSKGEMRRLAQQASRAQAALARAQKELKRYDLAFGGADRIDRLESVMVQLVKKGAAA